MSKKLKKHGLLKKQNVRAHYKFKLQVIRDIEENHLPLADASLKYIVSNTQLYQWRKRSPSQRDWAKAIQELRQAYNSSFSDFTMLRNKVI